MCPRLIRDVIKSQAILTMAPETSVRAAAREMKTREVGAVMVAEAGKLVGIFTERDGLFRVLAEGRDPGDLTTIEEPMALEQIRDALAGT